MKAIPITAPAFREILLFPMPLLDHLQCQVSPRSNLSGMSPVRTPPTPYLP
jgi:hypothetical protein